MEEQVITGKEIGRAAQRALEYQRYLFRRAYGVYYFIWALAILLLTLPAPLSTFLSLTGILAPAVTIAADAISCSARHSPRRAYSVTFSAVWNCVTSSNQDEGGEDRSILQGG